MMSYICNMDPNLHLSFSYSCGQILMTTRRQTWRCGFSPSRYDLYISQRIEDLHKTSGL